MPSPLAGRWPLDPAVTFLNHGSFGACPTAVLDAQRRERDRMEAQPVRFLARELGGRLAGVREALGQFVGADPDDLALIANAGAVVSYSPINIIRRGRSLDFHRYRKAGVTIALGTDTYPRDLIENMRVASYVAKVEARSLFAGSAGEMFTAATLGGARALGRDDLGRLAPGAKADITIVRLRAPDSLRWGVVYDPIKALVDTGIGDDVDTVLVDGQVRMRERRVPGVDLDELLHQAQAAAEQHWAHVQEWDILGRTAAEMCPWAFPIHEPSPPPAPASSR